MTLQVGGNTVVTSDRIVQLTNGATGSRPGSPVTGQLFYDTTLAKLIVWNGSAWKEAASSGSPPTPALWSWGYNRRGRLGDGTTTYRSSPVSAVGGFTDWTQISAGNAHTAAIRANGQAWCWGYNLSGRLGDDTAISRSSPVSVVGSFTDWTQISAGLSHTAAIRANGQAWCWGNGNNGRLGNSTTTTCSSPVSVVGGFTDWVQISAGGNHTAAIRANGQAWCWGYNGGSLGDNNGSGNRSSPVSVVGGFTDWTQITTGNSHTAAIRANGTAWTWGNGDNGRLGDNTAISRSSPVSVVGGFTDWIQISAGSNHTAAIRANGQAWCWGSNLFGQLGNSTTTTRSSPVSVVGGFTDWTQISAGSAHTAAIRANGTAWTWGYNGQGRLGTNNTTGSSSPVSVVGGYTDWVQISSGSGHTVAIRTQPATQTVRPLNQRNRF